MYMDTRNNLLNMNDLFQGSTWKIKSTGAPYVPAWRNKAFGMTDFDILLNKGNGDPHLIYDSHSQQPKARS